MLGTRPLFRVGLHTSRGNADGKPRLLQCCHGTAQGSVQPNAQWCDQTLSPPSPKCYCLLWVTAHVTSSAPRRVQPPTPTPRLCSRCPRVVLVHPQPVLDP